MSDSIGRQGREEGSGRATGCLDQSYAIGESMRWTSLAIIPPQTRARCSTQVGLLMFSSRSWFSPCKAGRRMRPLSFVQFCSVLFCTVPFLLLFLFWAPCVGLPVFRVFGDHRHQRLVPCFNGSRFHGTLRNRAERCCPWEHVRVQPLSFLFDASTVFPTVTLWIFKFFTWTWYASDHRP